MRILFCNIARMKYYKGIIAGVDEPQYGGEYVARTGDAYEKFPLCVAVSTADLEASYFLESRS